MRARTHTVLAASAVLALAAGPSAAPALAAPPATASAADGRAPDG
ncbi:peptidase, partial [Streptomyces rochei]|nr:peptidase [Streptomyces rochei]